MLMAIDMAVKGVLVLALAAAAGALLRRRSAATRYMVWSTSMLCLLLLPLLGGLVPAWTSPLLPSVPESWLPPPGVRISAGLGGPSQEGGSAEIGVLPRPTPRAPAMMPVETALQSGAEREPVPRAEILPSAAAETPGSRLVSSASSRLQAPALSAEGGLPWPVLLSAVYFFGVAVLLLQLMVGVLAVIRRLHGARPVADGSLRREFEAAVAHLGIERDVRLLQSDTNPVPVAWELVRPVVMMPSAAHDWPSERRRVAVVHELAHVQRRDCQMQLLAHLALALHWFNPLSWCALRQLRLEREHACDDLVLQAGTRPSDYAEHLLQIARGLLQARRPAWASPAMARSTKLEGRVAAILDPLHPRRLPERRNTMIALITSMALLLPLAALQPGATAQTGATTQTVEGPSSRPQASETTGHLPEGSEHRPATSEPVSTTGEHHSGTRAPMLAGAAAASGAQEASPTIDELVQMRIHGVSTEFIEEVRAAFGRPVTVRELVQMRIHGATPEFVRGIQDLFPGEQVTIQDVTNLRIHGASLDYIRGMRGTLGNDLTVRDITNLRIHGASAEFVRTMRELLPDEDIRARDVTQMRIHGVSTDMVRELQEDGYENLTVDDLVQMKIHGFDRWLRRRRGGR